MTTTTDRPRARILDRLTDPLAERARDRFERAEDKVRAAVVVIDAADMGDLDAELAVGDIEDFDLAWYATQELPFLLELL